MRATTLVGLTAATVCVALVGCSQQNTQQQDTVSIHDKNVALTVAITGADDSSLRAATAGQDRNELSVRVESVDQANAWFAAARRNGLLPGTVQTIVCGAPSNAAASSGASCPQQANVNAAIGKEKDPAKRCAVAISAVAAARASYSMVSCGIASPEHGNVSINLVFRSGALDAAGSALVVDVSGG